MITDKIKFAPGFAKEDSKTFASAGVEAKGIEPARIWRNLTNISVWPRFTDAITDIQFEDSADNDPHLFDKAQFYFDTTTGDRVRCQVIYFVHPKEDRAGRVAIQGTVFNPNGKQINEVVFEVMVGVPESEKTNKLDVEAAMSFKEEVPDAPSVNYGDMLESALRALVTWSEKHD